MEKELYTCPNLAVTSYCPIFFLLKATYNSLIDLNERLGSNKVVVKTIVGRVFGQFKQLLLQKIWGYGTDHEP